MRTYRLAMVKSTAGVVIERRRKQRNNLQKNAARPKHRLRTPAAPPPLRPPLRAPNACRTPPQPPLCVEEAITNCYFYTRRRQPIFFFCKIGYTTNQNTKCKPAIEFRSYALFNALVVRPGFESRRGQNFDQTMLAIEVLRTTESRTTISAANQMARRQNASGQRHLTAGQRHPESG